MTYQQIILQGIEDDVVTVNDTVYYTKQRMGKQSPVNIKKDISGSDVVTFSEHFIIAVEQAMTEDCLSRMSKNEQVLFFEWVDYQNMVPPIGRVFPDYVLEALDALVLDIWMCNETPALNRCYEEYTLQQKCSI